MSSYNNLFMYLEHPLNANAWDGSVSYQQSDSEDDNDIGRPLTLAERNVILALKDSIGTAPAQNEEGMSWHQLEGNIKGQNTFFALARSLTSPRHSVPHNAAKTMRNFSMVNRHAYAIVRKFQCETKNSLYYPWLERAVKDRNYKFVAKLREFATQRNQDFPTYSQLESISVAIYSDETPNKGQNKALRNCHIAMIVAGTALACFVSLIYYACFIMPAVKASDTKSTNSSQNDAIIDIIASLSYFTKQCCLHIAEHAQKCSLDDHISTQQDKCIRNEYDSQDDADACPFLEQHHR
ncbi:MAG TPA: hypothetical protein EYO59_02225 [Chromatiaceae bacterium]|nr:hypothetical protein [Chromatiaceae bacterium]